MTAADPRDGLHGLVARWRDPESPPLNQDQLRQAIRNGARLDCADDLEQALAHARPEAVDEYEAVGYAIKGGAEFYTEDYGTVSHKPPNGTILYVRTITPERAP